MKRIIIYFFCVISIGCITSSILYWESEKPGKIAVEKPPVEVQETDSEEQAMESVLKITNSSNLESGFCIKVEEGNLVIYRQETGAYYDSTSILHTDLPQHLQMQLEEGLYFRNEQELYEFLENYSS